MSFSEFIAMHGRGMYVWGSYGMALLIFVVEIALVFHKRTLTLKQIRMMRDAEGDQ
ncbi:MAG TPA: heme exporter protein CcmD [Gallionellaceae bacterium]